MNTVKTFVKGLNYYLNDAGVKADGNSAVINAFQSSQEAMLASTLNLSVEEKIFEFGDDKLIDDYIYSKKWSSLTKDDIIICISNWSSKRIYYKVCRIKFINISRRINRF